MKDVDFSYARGSTHCVYKSFLPLGALVSPFSRKLYDNAKWSADLLEFSFTVLDSHSMITWYFQGFLVVPTSYSNQLTPHLLMFL